MLRKKDISLNPVPAAGCIDPDVEKGSADQRDDPSGFIMTQTPRPVTGIILSSDILPSAYELRGAGR